MVLEVVPGRDECAALEAELAGFAGRYRVVRSGIWSREAGVTWDKMQYDDGQAWMRAVRPAKGGETPFGFASCRELTVCQRLETGSPQIKSPLRSAGP